jgi:hypothetical protein
MSKKRRTVTVCFQGLTALEEPNFLIEWEGKLYLTVAALEYDLEHPKITSEQRAKIKDLHGHLDRKAGLLRAAHLAADQIDDSIIAANMQDPPPTRARRARPGPNKT